MRKKTLIKLSIFLTVMLISFYIFNRHFKLIDLSTINVSAEGKLSSNKVKIIRGSYTISRKNDLILFSENNPGRTVYNGMQTGFLKTDYGENDFLIIYDDKYYYQFRHFILNNSHQHSYNLTLYEQQDTIYLNADIIGEDKMQFTKPLHLISRAKSLKCNLPIDTSKVIYNMTELQKP